MNMLNLRQLVSSVSLALAVSCASTSNVQVEAGPRLMAEWEPAQGTMIVYPFDLPDALITDLGHEAGLFVLVQKENMQQANDKLHSIGLELGHYQLILTEASSPWTRDWGPHQVESFEGQRVLVDHIFRGYPWVPADCDTLDINYQWGDMVGEDNAVNDIANALDLLTTQLPAIATGGNLLTDGHGRAFCTEAQIVENQAQAETGDPNYIDEARYRELLREHLGITDLVVLENTEPQGIQHIDCWMKVVDAETLLVKQAPVGHPEHDPIERNIEILRSLVTPTGGSYRILRIDCSPYRDDLLPAYTNSLRLNDVVHVPLFGGEADGQALETYRQAFPTCEVKGYLHTTWKHFDALHCRARALHTAL
ncbi:MAG: agmatine deiminase family protein [Planctomycetota bacterium]|nr:agmatine deiminase family protein [Planctomycetota bacterium]MDG2142510.1 agmatine deiminase family protein [Planctomycetota bacterium]